MRRRWEEGEGGGGAGVGAPVLRGRREERDREESGDNFKMEALRGRRPRDGGEDLGLCGRGGRGGGTFGETRDRRPVVQGSGD